MRKILEFGADVTENMWTSNLKIILTLTICFILSLIRMLVKTILVHFLVSRRYMCKNRYLLDGIVMDMMDADETCLTTFQLYISGNMMQLLNFWICYLNENVNNYEILTRSCPILPRQ